MGDSAGAVGAREHELGVWMAELAEIDRAIDRHESFKTQTFVFGTGGIFTVTAVAMQSANSSGMMQPLLMLLVAVLSAFLGMLLVNSDEAVLARIAYRETIVKPRIRELVGDGRALSSWEFINRETYGRNRSLARKFALRLTAPFPHALFYVSGLGSFGYVLYVRLATDVLQGSAWGWALALSGFALLYSWTAAFLTGGQWAAISSPAHERGIPFLRRRTKSILPHPAGWSPGDPHAHTNWSDGWRSVWGVANAAANRGLSWVAVTDHSDKIEHYWDAYTAALGEVATRIGTIALLPATEVTVVDEPGGTAQGDLLVYGWPSHGEPPPANRVSRPGALLERLSSHEGVVCAAAHPFNGGAPFSTRIRSRKYGAPAWRDWETPGLGCMELLSHELVASPKTRERWFESLDAAVQGGPRVCAIGGTDVHPAWTAPGSRGMTWIRFHGDGAPTGDDVCAALRSGRCVVAGWGDFGMIDVMGAGPGETTSARGLQHVSLVQRPARKRVCAQIRVFGPGGKELLSLDGPFDEYLTIHLDLPEAGYLVVCFVFEGWRGSKRAEVWTNPVWTGM